MTIEENNKGTWAMVKGFFITYDAEITMAIIGYLVLDFVF